VSGVFRWPSEGEKDSIFLTTKYAEHIGPPLRSSIIIAVVTPSYELLHAQDRVLGVRRGSIPRSLVLEDDEPATTTTDRRLGFESSEVMLGQQFGRKSPSPDSRVPEESPASVEVPLLHRASAARATVKDGSRRLHDGDPEAFPGLRRFGSGNCHGAVPVVSAHPHGTVAVMQPFDVLESPFPPSSCPTYTFRGFRWRRGAEGAIARRAGTSGSISGAATVLGPVHLHFVVILAPSRWPSCVCSSLRMTRSPRLIRGCSGQTSSVPFALRQLNSQPRLRPRLFAS